MPLRKGLGIYATGPAWGACRETEGSSEGGAARGVFQARVQLPPSYLWAGGQTCASPLTPFASAVPFSPLPALS